MYEKRYPFVGVFAWVIIGRRMRFSNLLDESWRVWVQVKGSRRGGKAVGKLETETTHELRQIESSVKILLPEKHHQKGKT